MADDQNEPESKRSHTIDLTATEIPSAEESKAAGAGAPVMKRAWPWLGAAFAGACGALAVVALWSLTGIGGRGAGADADRLTAIETQQRELAARPVPADPADRLASLEAAVTSLRERLDALAKRADDMMAASGNATARSETQAKVIADLRQLIERQWAETLSRGDLEPLDRRIAALENSSKSVERALEKPVTDPADALAIRLVAIATALRDAVERSEAFAAELSAAKPMVDAKAVAALEPFAATGVPPASALAQELTAVVPAIRASLAPKAGGGGVIERLQASAENLIRVRPVGEAPGDDADAVLARIEAKARRNDIAGARAELAKLPETARAPARDVIGKIDARATALAAARELSAAALAALGKPRS
jgi:hypothetical protein